MFLNKLYKIYWNDAKGLAQTTLDEFIKGGLAKTITIGYFVYEDEESIVIASEIDEDDMLEPDVRGDFTMIPKGWITRRVKLYEK